MITVESTQLTTREDTYIETSVDGVYVQNTWGRVESVEIEYDGKKLFLILNNGGFIHHVDKYIETPNYRKGITTEF